MKPALQVAAPPVKPLLLYDGDCRFCALWIRRWRQYTGDQVEYLPYQDASVAANFPELPRQRLETAVHLLEPSGTVSAGAEAVFRTLAYNPAKARFLRWYQTHPAFAKFTERAYGFIATHRVLFSWLTRLGWGQHTEVPTYLLTRGIFLRALGLIYLVAFLSLNAQILGLIGHNGILPTDEFVTNLKEQATTAQVGLDRYRQVPTFCWFDSSDTFLRFQCWLGVALAILVVIGIAPAPCLFLLWLIYLSLTTIGRVFLGFQWDNLLLETGLLAIFLAPLQLWPRPAHVAPPSRIALWLLRWLLFRLMFESGIVKLLSGDVLWRNLTALTVHYETQPLPTWIGWYAHQLPPGFQRFSCVVMFIIELAAPLLIFAPRRPRFWGAGALIFFQVCIILTGNYTFFNWLTIALCFLLFDDLAWQKLIPAALRNRFAPPAQHPTPARPLVWRRAVTSIFALVIVPISLWQLAGTCGWRGQWAAPVAALHQWLSPFRSVNHYGLFAVMTPSRPEIIIEGSNDGVTWLPYEFKYKPGDLTRRPKFVAPHQPRLDWQLWFAALGTWRQNPWLLNFCGRLLEGQPETVALLAHNPFPDKPPRQIRASLYDYRFTDFTERRRTGAWWRREYQGPYLPPFSATDLQRN